jgi:hypothetical protein
MISTAFEFLFDKATTVGNPQVNMQSSRSIEYCTYNTDCYVGYAYS